MKILIYSTNFYPEQTGIGKYSGEMAFWLANKGHDVRVICSAPYYPKWKIEDGYSNTYKVSYVNGVMVMRAPIWVPNEQTGIKRIIHLLTFSLSSLPYLFAQVLWRPNLVFNVAPAFICAPAGLLLAKITGAKSWLHFQDFEVDIAFKMNFLKGRLKQSLIFKLERFIIRNFDFVSTISNKMLDKLSDKCLCSTQKVLLPNWVDVDHISPLKAASEYRSELDIPVDTKVFMFSGTMGGKQGLSIIPTVARLLLDRTDILFILGGDGAVKLELMKAAEGLKNVKFLPLQPFERLGQFLGLADVHMLTQNVSAEDLVLPSKLSGMLASGRPILATCEEHSQIAQVVKKCGLVVPPSNPEAFRDAVLKLADDPDLRQDLGALARKCTLKIFEKNSILRDFVAVATSGEYKKP